MLSTAMLRHLDAVGPPTSESEDGMVNSGSLARGIAILERLVGETDGLPLAQIAQDLDLAKSAAHRVLASLMEAGYVNQLPESGRYALSLRLPSLGLRHLVGSTLYGLAIPLLTRVADESGQLVRLGLVDGNHLVWVAKAQGARTGLRYDPDHGSGIPLALSASGLAWLSRLPEDLAMRLVATERTDQRHPLGHNAPKDLIEVMERVRAARERGWAVVHDSVEEGISAVAAPLISPSSPHPLGVVSIAGPTMQLTDERIEDLVPSLLGLAAELSDLATSFQHASMPPGPAGLNTAAPSA
jgi:DNA-binding IclR family transcriptional regulator